MVLHDTAELTMLRRMEPFLRIVAFLSLGLAGTTAEAAAQSPEQVRLTLLEGSARTEGRVCTLEVVVAATAGEAILTCHRNTPPVSQLGAHRALTAAEAARLFALASGPAASLPQSTGSPEPARVDRAKATVTITRGAARVVLDVTEDMKGLSAQDQQTLRLLREIADDLRGTGRR